MRVLQATARNGSDDVNGTAASISGASGVEETIVDDEGRGSVVGERGGQSGVSASAVGGRLGEYAGVTRWTVICIQGESYIDGGIYGKAHFSGLVGHDVLYARGG